MTDAGAPMLGRDRELAILMAAASRTVASATSNVVLVHGEPGIGKSTLLAAFIDELSGADPPVLVGYGQAMTSTLGSDSFQVVRECLRALVSSAETSAERAGSRVVLDRVAQAFRSNAPAWLEAVPVVGTLLAAGIETGRAMISPSASPDHLTSRLDELTALVTELTEVRPVVLVLDDLHWADGAAVDLVMALALKVGGPFLLVLAYRADDLRRGPDGEPHPMMRAVFRLRRYRTDMVEIPLERLSPAQTRELILASGLAGVVRPDEAELERLVTRSAGIPLYAESLAIVRGKVAGGAGQQHRESTSREIDAVLEERLSFVGADDQRLLEATVAVGYTFEVEFVAALARVDVDEVYDRLDALMRDHHLIVPATSNGALDRYSLSHPLLAEVLARRSAANPPRWRRTQQRLVGILLAAPPSDELAVRAATAALAAKDGRAGELSLQAARRSYAGGNVSQARHFAQSAVDLIDHAERFSAATLLTQCLSAQGDHPQVVAVATAALADAAGQAAEPQQREQLALLRARSLRMTADWASLALALDELDAAGVPELADQVLMLRAEIALGGPVPDVARCIEICAQLAGRSSDAGLVSRALGHRGLAHLAGYEPDAAEHWLTKAIETARDHHPYTLYEAIFWYCKKKMACLELDAAWTQLELLASTSDRSGVASETPFHLRDSSRVLGLRGDAQTAASTFARYADATPTGSRDRVMTMLCWQIAELESVRERALADRFLAELTTVLPATVLEPARRDFIERWAAQLSGRSAAWHPTTFAVEVLGADRTRAGSASAIFRFNIPDLARLRAIAGDSRP